VSAQLRAAPGAQTPPWHESPVVQNTPSSQTMPFARAGCVHSPAPHTSVVQALPSSVHGPVRFACTQPVAGLQLSSVHSLRSLQLAAGPGWQAPLASQVSPTVQALPSVHAVPGVTFTWSQRSAASLHVSVVQGFASLQLWSGPAVHVPFWQLSATVQNWPSSQLVPLVRFGCVQAPAVQTSLVQVFPSSVQVPPRGVWTQPVAALHVSVVHSLPSSQLAATPGWQTPDTSQASPTVHALPSVHELPGVAGVWSHWSVVSLQVSIVHALVSLQSRAEPPRQVPLWQVSATVQNWPSLQPVPFGSVGWAQLPAAHVSVVHGFPSSVHAPLRLVKTQPVVVLHVSVVHSRLSLQTVAGPGWHAPVPLQVSFDVHALPSLHGAPDSAFTWWQPPGSVHVSTVQELPSSQLSGVVKQTPPWHCSLPLQTSPSEHDVPSETATWRHPRFVLHESVVHDVPSLQFSSRQ
jgi:hypothetical protein